MVGRDLQDPKEWDPRELRGFRKGTRPSPAIFPFLCRPKSEETGLIAGAGCGIYCTCLPRPTSFHKGNGTDALVGYCWGLPKDHAGTLGLSLLHFTFF